ncbi:MAG: hypothetical protein ABIP51_07975 [Bacteroidia bacterium]
MIQRGFFYPVIIDAYNTLGYSIEILVAFTIGSITYVGMLEHLYTNNYIHIGCTNSVKQVNKM